MMVRGVSVRLKGSDRAVGASLLAAAVAWLLHAGVDWDWQMPVITWWLFAAGGLGLARGKEGRAAAFPIPGRLGRVLAMLGIALVVVLPAQAGLSQRNLARAIVAFDRGDCNAAVGYGLKATSEVGARAEPYEVIAYCDVRYGHTSLALTAVQNAINRDPGDWEYRYDLAVVRGLAGLDPRSAARQARRLNPLSRFTISLSQAMRTSDPRRWRAGAARAPLLVP